MFKKFICIMLALSCFRKYSTVGGFMRTFHVARTPSQSRPACSSRFRTFRFLNTQEDPLINGSVGRKPVKIRLPIISEISEEVARVELVALDSELRRHNELYFEKNEPEISDAAYDKLVNRASALVGKFRHLGELVPTLNTVGLGKSSKFAPFKHSAPMLSLSKAFNTEELTSFMDRVDKAYQNVDIPVELEYVLEPKIDGLSLGIIYEYQTDTSGGQWCMTGAGTRGDGEVGENVTENVRKYLHIAIPEYLSSAQVQTLLNQSLDAKPENGMKIEVRGEVFISRSDFRTLNQQRAASTATSTATATANEKGVVKDAQLATARNAAAGALRKINPSTGAPEASAQKYLQFFAYSLLVHTHNRGEEHVHDLLSRQSEALTVLQSLGFKIAQPWTLCTSPQSDNPATNPLPTNTLRAGVLSSCTAWENQRHQWDFDADGAVLKVNQVQLQQALGANSRCPKWAVAYKFAADKVLTSLRDIEVRVGRTGVLTPVARVAPVKVGGVMVESATLHNENEVNRLKVQIGDHVWLKRAGDVIPKILGVERGLEPLEVGNGVTRNNELYRLPTACPECSSPTERVYSTRFVKKSHKTAVTTVTGSDAIVSESLLVEGEENDNEVGFNTTREEPLVSVRCTGGPAVCPAQAIEQISHFASKDAANIDGLGRSRVEDLFEVSIGGIVKSIVDLYELRQRDLNHTANSTDSISTFDNGAAVPVPSLRGRKGWGDRSVNHLLAAIDKARVLDDYKFMFGLGVRYIGVENARLAVAEFGGFPALWKYLQEESDKLKVAGLQYHMLPRQRAVRKTKKSLLPDSTTSDGPLTSTGDDPSTTITTSGMFLHECAPRLQAIDGLGPRAIQAFLEFASHPRSVALVQGLLQHVQFTSAQPLKKAHRLVSPETADQVLLKGNDVTNAGLPSDAANVDSTESAVSTVQSKLLTGRVAVFTGKLESGMSRDEAQALFESFGGEVRSSVNKSVNLLIQAGDARASSKYNKAVALGIEVWTEDEWSAFIKRHN